MQIWTMDPYACGDKRLPHHIFPPKRLTPDQLTTKAGVMCYKIDMEDTMNLKKRLSRVKAASNVNSSDVLAISEALNGLSGMLEELYEPVIRDTDWVVLITDGMCYFDVEPLEDEWIRLQCEKGDLVVIPKGLTHRFTVTPQNYVQVQRFFHKRHDAFRG
ncbi:unnamed protein product, partial [Mesorhabditis belari]|uniref:Uncharacterized protein n=1 Tax=Mesorhabditis belari TaxID=2138241 RepID=A0AAF3FQT6_9BILA